jgi:D-serine deaminase-like pyridoxal phosphate-dependent protein
VTLDDIPTPALVLDLDRLENNLDWMARRCTELGVQLRPHFKTHKCVEIAEMQRDRGARGATVSTLFEATALIDHGFEDVTWAFPFIPSRITEAKRLAERATLRLVVDTSEAVDVLERDGTPFPVLLKVDCGYHRAGVDPSRPEARALAERIARSRTLMFDGILSHSGHAYDAPTPDGRADIAESERRVMTDFAGVLESDGVAVSTVSVGSTPSMRSVKSLDGVTEARPGNYALFDYFQADLGTCSPAECAVTVMATVVSSQPAAQHSIIDAGALALSKDPGPARTSSAFGEVFADYAAGTLDPDHRVTGLSQEHGKLSGTLPPGSRVRVLPNHSCLTVAQFDDVYVARGGEVTGRWRIWRGRG